MTQETKPAQAEAKPKEYDAPEVRTEEVFETLALTCNKVTVGASCSVSPGGPAPIRS